MKHIRMISVMMAIVLMLSMASLAACSPQQQNAAAPSQPAQASEAPQPAVSAAPAESAAPQAPAEVKKEFAELYEAIPFQDMLVVPEGEVKINGETRPIKIGVSQTGLNHPWRVERINGAKAEVERHANIELVVTDGNVDVVKQSSDIDDLLAMGCDAIVLSPVEDAGLSKAVDKVMAAGIPIILLDRDCSTDKTLFIGQSNVTLGSVVAREMVKALEAKYGEAKGNVLEITGLPGSSPAIDRQKGFRDVIKDYPNIKVIAEGDGQWIRDPAMKLMEDWLVAYKDIDAVFSHAEESSWGADLAIVRAGRTGDGIMHFTMDGSNEGFVAVKDGQFMADGNYTPYIGHLGVRAAIYYLTGQEVPNTEQYEHGIKLVPPDLPAVVQGNADEWIGKGWGDY